MAARNDNALILKELLQAYRTMCASSSSDAHHLQPSATTTSVLDLRTEDGLTPLHFTAATDNFEAVRLLLEAGASKGARDAKGIHLASGCCRDTSVLDMLQLRIVNGTINGIQFTALHIAALNDCIAGVRWLLVHGALVDVTNEGMLWK